MVPNRHKSRNKLEKEVYHKKWTNNIVVGAEVITLLELLEVIKRKGWHISQGLLVIGVDNRKVYRRITQDIKKARVFTYNAWAEIS